MKTGITRESAIVLLKKYNKEPFHLQHALTVGGVMRWYAGHLGYDSDAEFWEIAGLLHDVDYEIYPEEHCKKTGEILRERNWPEDYIHAIQSHGYGLCIDIEPIEKMEKVLYTIDELTGLITAAAFMRPSRSILDMEVKSIKKKWKQKSFAAGVNRELIEGGAAMLGMELDTIINETIKGMQTAAEEIGLKGSL
jgi:putative nucleotidyltransferase with HDIG domain